MAALIGASAQQRGSTAAGVPVWLGVAATEDPEIGDPRDAVVFLRVRLIRTCSFPFVSFLTLLGFGLATLSFAVAVFHVFPHTRSMFPVA